MAATPPNPFEFFNQRTKLSQEWYKVPTDPVKTVVPPVSQSSKTTEKEKSPAPGSTPRKS